MAEEYKNTFFCFGKKPEVEIFISKFLKAIEDFVTKMPEACISYESEMIIGVDDDTLESIDQKKPLFEEFMIVDEVETRDHILIKFRSIRTRRMPIPIEYITQTSSHNPNVYIEYIRYGDCSGLTQALYKNNEILILRKRTLEQCVISNSDPLITKLLPLTLEVA